MEIHIQPLQCPNCKGEDVGLLNPDPKNPNTAWIDESVLICEKCQTTFLAKKEYFGPWETLNP